MPPLHRALSTHAVRCLRCVYFALLAGQLGVSAAAQTFGVGLSHTPSVELDLTLTDLDLGQSKGGFRVAGGVAEPLELGVSLRETTSFGPVGNLIVHSSANLDSTGRFEFAFGAEGVVAMVAARAQISLFTAEVGRFEPAEAFEEEARPFLLEPPLDFGAALDLGGSYRVNRGLIVSAAPSLYLTDAEGLGGRLALEGRFVKAVGPDDLRARGLTYISPEGEAFGALGLEYGLNRRGLPSGLLTLWAGLNGHFSPGASLQLSQTLKAWGGSYSLLVAAEPYRLDVLPYRAALTYRQSLGPSALEASFYGTLSPRISVPAASFRLGYSLPF